MSAKYGYAGLHQQLWPTQSLAFGKVPAAEVEDDRHHQTGKSQHQAAGVHCCGDSRACLGLGNFEARAWEFKVKGWRGFVLVLGFEVSSLQLEQLQHRETLRNIRTLMATDLYQRSYTSHVDRSVLPLRGFVESCA